jgi:putative acetyltransferase
MSIERKDITIRSAHPGDLSAILFLFDETIRSTCHVDYTPAQIEAWVAGAQDTARWRKRIETQYFIVALRDEQIIGFASLQNPGYIDLLYVHKDHLRRGIASALYDALEAHASLQLSSGDLTLTSDVSITARLFFEKQGFTADKENRRLLRGVDIMNYHMSKRLIKPR